MAVFTVTEEQIRSYINKLHERGESSVEINRKLSTVHNFLEWAVAQGKIDQKHFEHLIQVIAKHRFEQTTPKSSQNDRSHDVEYPEAVITDPTPEVFYTGEKKTDGIAGEISFKFDIKSYQVKSFLRGLFKKKPFASTSGDLKVTTDQMIENQANNIVKRHLDDKSPTYFVQFGLLLIIMAFLGAGLFNQFFKKAPTPFAYSTNPVKASRHLSFQGRLTDSLGNPITTAANVVFKLYNGASSTSALYTSGTCSVTPDQDGVFNSVIGKDCGSEIGSNVFSENPNVYLGVTVGSDSEMTPRQQIANVGYAINAETLQGLPPGESASSIPFINSDGNLLVAVASPGIRSTFESATFSISSANAVMIQSAGTGDVTLNASGSGNLLFQTGSTTRATITNGGEFGIGTLAPAAKLDVNGTLRVATLNPSGSSAVCIDGSNILSSCSGAFPTGTGTTNYITKWTGTSTISNSQLYDNGVNVGIGTTSPSYLLEVAGTARVNGNFTIGDDTSDTLTINGSTLSLGTSATAGLNINNGLLNFDTTNSRIGIGTTTPSYKLDVQAGTGIVGQFSGRVIGADAVATNEFTTLGQVSALAAGAWSRTAPYTYLSTPTDNVGIGTTVPGEKLDVTGGNIRTDGGFIGGDLTLGYDDTSATITTNDAGENLTIDPNAAGTVFFHGSTYQIDSSGNFTFGASLTPTTNYTLGSASFTGTITTSDWTISSTGDLAGIGTINSTYLQTGASYINLVNSAELRTNGTSRLTNAGALQNITGYTQTSGTASYTLASSLAAFAVQTDLFTIDTQNGRVGIGTTAPLQKLHVAGDINIESGSGIRINDTATLGTYLRGDGTRFVSSAIQYGDLPSTAQGWTDDGTVVRLTTDTDKVGIGTTAPGSTLGVSGNLSVGGSFSTVAAPTNGAIIQGNVGIGNSNPSVALDVTGQGQFSSTLTASNGFTMTTGALSLTSTSGAAALTLSSATTAFNVNSGLLNIDTTNSRVGIGTTAPTQQLEIAGTGYATTSFLSPLFTGNGTAVTFGSTGQATTINGNNWTQGGLVYGTGTAQAITGALSGILQGNGTSAPTAITGTANYIPKWNASAPYLSGTSLIYDTGTNVGINTTAPGSRLGVNGNAAIGGTYSLFAAPTNGLLVEGSVGIGTTSVGTTLEVAGTGRFSSTLTASNGLTLTTGALSLTSTSGTASLTLTSSQTAFNVQSGLFNIDTQNSRIGVGTTAPSYTLDVNGTLRATGNVTLGDASGDTVTSEAAAWTFTSATTVELATSTTGLNVEAGLFNIDTQNSRIGIGTTAPAEFTLEIAGHTGPSTNNTYNLGSNGRRWAAIYTNQLCLSGTCESSFNDLGPWDLVGTDILPDSGTYNVSIGTTASAGSAKLYVEGNVGIGTTAPSQPLHVVGNIYATTSVLSPLFSGNGSAVTFGLTGQTTTINGSNFTNGGLAYGTGTALTVTSALNGIVQGNGAAAPTAITGTANFVPRWSATAPYLTSTSSIFDNGTNVGIGTTDVSTGKLSVNGRTYTTDFTMTNGASAGYFLTSDGSGNASWADISDSAGPWTRIANNLYPDNTLWNVSIGATNSGNADLYVNGTVGIGTTDPGTTLDVVGTGRFSSTLTASNGLTLTTGALSLTSTSGNAALTLTSATTAFNVNSGLFNIDTTNSRVGIGTTAPAYVLDVNGTFRATGAGLFDSALTATGTMTANGALDANGLFTLGDNGDTGAIDTSDWDISTTGILTGISGITSDGGYTQTGTSANSFTGTSTFSNATYSAFFMGGNVGIGTTAPSTFELEIAGDIGPTADNLYNLGSASRQWASIYTANLCISGVCETSFNDVGPWDLAGNDLYPDSAAYNVGIGTTGGAGSAKLFVNGNVGIGTTAPGAALDVIGAGKFRSTGGYALQLNASGTSYGFLNPTSSAFQIYGDNNADLALGAWDGSANTERLRIKAATGNVGIGTTAPTSKLAVAGGLSVGTTAAGSIFTNALAPSGGAIFEGSVGIGTTSPGATLDVVGNIRSTTGTLQIGNTTNAAYNRFGTSTANGGNVTNSSDVFISDSLEVDGRLYTNFIDGGSTTIDVQNSIIDLSNSSRLVISNTLGSTNAFDITSTLTGTSYAIRNRPTFQSTAGSQSLFGLASTPTISASSTNALTYYAGQFALTDANSLANTGYGLYVDGTTANASDITYALYSNSGTNYFGGNVGVGTTGPTSLFSVGTGATSPFQVTANGNIARILGVGYTFPSAQAAGGGYVLENDGSGNLSWTNPAASAGPWTQSGDNLYPDAWSTTNVAIGADNAGTADFYVNGVVGIGTTAPGTTLDVVGTGRFSSTLTASNGLTLTTGALNLTSTSGAAALTLTSSTTAFNVNSGVFNIDTTNGRVGIGTTNPLTKLHVNAAANDNFLVGATNDLATGITLQSVNDANNALQGMEFRASSYYFSTGNVGISTTAPASKLAVAGGLSVGTTAAGSIYTTALAPSGGAIFEGAVGIGTTTPASSTSLDVRGPTLINTSSGLYNTNASLIVGKTSNPLFILEDIGNNTAALESSSTGFYFGTETGSLVFKTGTTFNGLVSNTGTEAMRVVGSSLGIGTTAPSHRLHVLSSGVSDGLFVGEEGSNNGLRFGYNNTTNRGEIQSFESGSANNLHINPYGGNVGIGTTAPSTKLHVSGASGHQQVRIEATAASTVAGLQLVANSYTWELQNRGSLDSPNNRMSLFGSGSELLSMLTGGNLGIGITSPSQKLDVQGAIRLGADAGLGNVLNTSVGSTSPSGILYWGNRSICDSSGNCSTGSEGPWTQGTGIVYLDTLTDNVNIGSTANLAKLSVVGDTDEIQLLVRGNGTQTNNIFRIQNSSAADLLGFTNGGNLGIGTTNPGAKIDLGTDVTAQKVLLYNNGNDKFGFGIQASEFRQFFQSSSHLSIGTVSSSDGTTFAEKVRIDNTGNVGIGTTAPGMLLHLYTPSTGTDGIKLQAGTTNGAGKVLTYSFFHNNGVELGHLSQNNDTTGGNYNMELWQHQSGYLRFGQNNAEVMRITGGNVGIGTTAPSAKLTLGNNVATGFLDNYSEYQQILYDNGSAAGSYGFGIKGNTMVFNSGAGAYSFDRAGNSTAMYIDTAGNVGIGTTSPSDLLSLGTSGDLGLGTTNGDSNRINFRNYATPSVSGYFNIEQLTNWGSEVSLWVGRAAGGSGSQNSWMTRIVDDSIGYPNQNTHISFNSTSTFSNSILYVGLGNSANNTRTALLTETGAVLANTRGTVGIGTSAATSKLAVSGGLSVGTTSPSSTYTNTLAPSGGAIFEGNVGIGTTNPGQKLTIGGAVRLLGSGSNNADLYISGTDLRFDSYTGNTILGFYNNVGVGTTNPSTFKLQVAGSVGPQTDDTYDLGSAALSWNDIFLDGQLCFDTTDCMTSTTSAGGWRDLGAVVSLVTDADNVSIGTSANLAKLAVVGDADETQFLVRANGTQTSETKIVRFQNSSSTDLFTLLNSGNVGIGTTAPAQKLHVFDAVDGGGIYARGTAAVGTGFSLENSSGTRIASLGIAGTTGNWIPTTVVGDTVLMSTQAKSILFATQSLERMRIDSNGNVGIGTTAPNGALQVGGNLTATTLYLDNQTGYGSRTAKQWITYSASDTNGNTMTGGTGLNIHNNDTTDGNWSTLSFSSYEGAGGNNVAGAAIRTRFTSRSISGWARGDLAFFTMPQNGLLERMRITYDGNVGIGVSGPASKLDIDTGSNTLGLRLRGADEVNELADFYIGSGGQLQITTQNTGDSTAWIEVDPEDDQYGFILRDSNTGSSVYANLYTMDSGTDYINMVVNATNGNTGLVIDDDDQVGIGVTNPVTALDVRGNNILNIGTAGGGGILRFGGDGGGTGNQISYNSSMLGYFTSQSLGMRFFTNSGSDTTNPEFYIGNDGNVGVGTTSTAAKLDVAGTLRVGDTSNTSSTALCINSSLILGGCTGSFVTGSGTTNYVARWTSSSAIGTGVLYDNGTNVGVGTTSPLASLHASSNSTTASSQIVASDVSGNSGSFLGMWSGWSGGTPNMPAILWSAGEDLRFGGGTTNMGNGTGFSESMRIESGGDVGIGTTNPAQKLDIASGDINLSGTQYIRWNNETEWSIRGRTTASTTMLGSNIKSVIYVGNGASEGFAVATGGTSTGLFEVNNTGNAYLRGNLGIGTTNPTAPLTILATGVTSNDAVKITVGNPQVNANGGVLTSGNLLNIGSTNHSYMTLDNRELTVGGHKNNISIGNVVDVFVYDTAKDIDGGRWTDDERAKSASWYNETKDNTGAACVIGTNDRCGANPFPKKAVIVATTTSIHIFDAKDNSLWMSFISSGSTDIIRSASSYNINSVTALNGKIYLSQIANGYGLTAIDFKTDSAMVYDANASERTRYNSNIANRNADSGHKMDSTIPALSTDIINDVAATVIGGKTMLGIGTSAGGALINETDQAIYNSSYTGNMTAVAFAGDDMYMIAQAGGSVRAYYNVQNFGASWSENMLYHQATTPAVSNATTSVGALFVTQGTSTIDGKSNTIYYSAGQTSAPLNGLMVIQEKQSDETNGSVKYYSVNSISEEQIGDIRGMWPLNNANSSTDFEDVSVKANTLTGTNITAAGDSVSGVRGTATDFDGSTEYLDAAAADADFEFGDVNFSLGLWFKTTSTVSSAQGLISNYRSTTPYYDLVLDSTGVPNFSTRDASSNTVTNVAPTDYDDSNWHFLVGVRDTTNNILRLYVDGVLVDTDADTRSANFYNGSTRLQIGAENSTSVFNGSIDEVFVTAEALTAAQIKHMYEVGRRALQNHATQSQRGVTVAADASQQLAGSTDTVYSVAASMDTGLIYVGTANGTSGAVSMIGMDSDTIEDQLSSAMTSVDDVGGTWSTNNNAVIDLSVGSGYGTGMILAFASNNSGSGGVWIESDSTSFKDFLASSYNPFGDNLTQSNLNVDSIFRVVNQISSRLDNLNLGVGATSPMQYVAESFRIDTNGHLLSRSLFDSTTAMQFQNAAGTTVLDIDTTNSRVGIGTTAPENKLHIWSSEVTTANSDSQLILEKNGHSFINILGGASSQAGIVFGNSGAAAEGQIYYDNGNDSLNFWTSSAAKMIITSAGNVGIGTTSPSVKLHVIGSGIFSAVASPALTTSRLHVEGTANDLTSQLSLTGTGVMSGFIRPSSAGMIFGADTGGFTWRTGATVGTTGDTGTERMRIDSNGDVGIGTTDPTSKLHIARATGAGSTDGIKITADSLDFRMYAETASLGAAFLGTESAHSLRFYTGGTGISNTKMTILSGGNVGIGTTNPTSTLHVVGDILADRLLDRQGSTYLIDPANTGTAINIAGNMILDSSGTGTITFNGGGHIKSNGATTINIKGGSTSPLTTSLCVTYFASADASCDGKIDAGTIDPPYTINGKKYATFMPSMTGVKEETTGTVATNTYVTDTGYEYTIDFTKLPEGSDLWLFSKTTNLRENIAKLVPLLTPTDNARVWYKIDKDGYKLTIYSSRPTTVAYRLTAPRFDHEVWKNTRAEGGAGHIIEDPDLIGTMTLNHQGEAPQYNVTGTQDSGFKIQDQFGQLVEEVGTFSKAIVANLKVGSASIQHLASRIIVVEEKITSPVVDAEKVVTAKIEAKTPDLTIDLSKQTPSNNGGKLAQIIVKGLDEQTVAAIDAAGNATFSGSLTASEVIAEGLEVDSASISGTLAAQDATISGTLVASEIRSENIDRMGSNIEDLGSSINTIQTLLSKIQNEPLPDPRYYQNLDGTAITTGEGTLMAGLDGTQLLTDSLIVTGTANFFDVSVANTFKAGNILIGDDSVVSLASDFKLSALNTITLFDGAVVIGKNGNITTKGQVIAQGGVKTNKIEALNDGDDLDVILKSKPEGSSQEKSKFSIKNAEAAEVASIDASGSAKFSGLALDKYTNASASAIIAAAENFENYGFNTPALETKTKTAGLGVIPENSSEIVIFNENIKEDSLIYLTPMSDSPVAGLTVVKKETCPNTQDLTPTTSCKPYFKVASPSLTPVPTQFNWLIIN